MKVEEDPLLTTSELPLTYRLTGARVLLITNVAVNFSFQGFNAISSTFYNDYMNFSQNLSSFFTNFFFFLCYGSALIGGVIADSFIGHVKNQFYGFIAIFVGMSLVIISMLIKSTLHYTTTWLLFIGILFFTIANGIVKPSSTTLLGDQFLPHESAQRSVYFSWYYFTIQLGAVGSSIAISILFQQFKPLLPFAILWGFTGIIIPLYYAPSSYYKKKLPGSNVLVSFLKILWAGMTLPRDPKEEHWLDKACSVYELSLIHI
eukprot:TRINITY_DN7614_c0_g1_i2.p1 TRINITY_DN7614_c0_g1~~TRINITY_DN7614_c0_g1_i2.p1  ORF type:complete len:261 (-),score=31.77 TRINITY_DN7614_c0_g1_i2:24-806(-)